MMKIYRSSKLYRSIRTGGLVLLLLLLGGVGLTYAVSNPGFLTENTSDIAAGTKTYRVWYTTDCNTGVDCECDNLPDTDTSDPPDGTPDQDSPNDCIATVDSGTDGIPDTGPDDDGDGILNVMDLDWVGGGTGVVESVPRNVQRTVNRYVNDWNLKNPYWDTDSNRNIYVYDIGYLGLASGNGSGEELDTSWMLTQAPEPRGTVLHELWHNIQFAYGISAAHWLMEGQARMLQDKVYSDLDNRVTSRYHNSVNSYLGNTTYVNWEDRDDDDIAEFAQADGLLGASYNASLWWTYIADQAGSSFVGSAGEGMDALIAVLDQADDHGRQGINAVDRVLHDRIGQGFDDTFWDFTIANYAKDYDLSRLNHSYLDGRDPERVLLYSDEDRSATPPLIYGPVERTLLSGSALFSGSSGSHAAMSSDVNDPDAMSAYGANYYELEMNPDCLLVYWRVIGDEGARFMHSWMVIQEDTNGDSVEEVNTLLRSESKDFARAIWNGRTPGSVAATTKLVGIVATAERPYGYSWEAGCAQPGINIINPTTENPAFVGEPMEPGRFLLWLEVTGAAGTSTYVAGLDWQRDFTVTVGGDVSTILNGDYVQNQYWLLVQAPTKPAASLGDRFDVTAHLGPVGGISDTESDAIVYDVLTSDQVLVIDRSGSMGSYNKLESAKTAARLFADVVQENDQLGVVSFSNNATVEFPMTLVPDQDDSAGVRANAQTAINSINDDAATSIGDGLDAGQTMLSTNGILDHQWVMVLLSDGMENEPLYWNDVRAGIVATQTKVFAIALGQDADEDKMREIAQATCGTVWQDQCYQFIEESGVLMTTYDHGTQAISASPLANGLADIYRRIEETIAGHQRLWQGNGTLETSTSFNIEVHDGGVRDAYFSFNWIDASAPLNVNINGPSGSFIKLSDGLTHVTFYAEKLDPGTYTVDLSAPAGASQWIGSLSGRIISGTEFHAFLGNTSASARYPGLPIRLQASLSDDHGPISQATVQASVRHPDGDITTIILVDDGGPYDDIAGDGVYGYIYDRINRPLEVDIQEGHSWVFDLYATGKNNDGNMFTRYKRLTYTPYLGREQFNLDIDKDKMIDFWENRFPNVETGVADGDEDTDNDGLTNLEEFELGALPEDPDTDKGGETDGSEVANGRNPLYTADDVLPPLTGFWVENQEGQVILHFNPQPEFKALRIYRRTGMTSGFVLIKEVTLPGMLTTAENSPMHEPPDYDPSKGQYRDESLPNDQDYFYYLQPVGASGVVGAPSNVLYAEPAKDPHQPESVVVINDDDDITHSKNVTLNFQGLTLPDGTLDVHAMQIANHPDLNSAPWLPFKPVMPWTLDPDPDTGLAFVYVRFRDGAGNVSDVIFGDGILYDPPTFTLPGWLVFRWLVFYVPPIPNIMLQYTPLNFSNLNLFGDDSVQTLNAPLADDGTTLYYGGISFDLTAYDAMSQTLPQLPEVYSITLSYEDWQWAHSGIGSESLLNLYWQGANGWETVLPCVGCSHDHDSNTIAVVTDKLGTYALLGEAARPLFLPVLLKGY